MGGAISLRFSLLILCLLGVGMDAEEVEPSGIASQSAELGQAPPQRPVDRLLWTAMARYQDGALEQSWAAFRSFLHHPQRNEVDPTLFRECFVARACPSFAALGAMLGKPRSDVGAPGAFCPHWAGRLAEAEQQGADHLEATRSRLDRLRMQAFGGSCQRWGVDISRPLAAEASSFETQKPKADIVPLSRWPADLDHARRHAELAFREEPIKLIVDTGSTGTFIDGGDWLLEDYGAEIVGKLNVNLPFVGGLREATVVKVPTLRWGRNVYGGVLVRLLPAGVLFGQSLLGMDILLRHRAVCFSWERAKLYLGELGPCEGGEAATDARIREALIPTLRVFAADGSHHFITLDTGSSTSYCSETYVRANRGRQAIAFGSHQSLWGHCDVDSELKFGSSWEGATQGILGMDVLLEFRAFGWQLDPFVMFFVPR